MFKLRNKLFSTYMADVHICLGNIYCNSLFWSTIKILILNKKENKNDKKNRKFHRQCYRRKERTI